MPSDSFIRRFRPSIVRITRIWRRRNYRNSGKHGRIWVIKNTAGGRAIADKIDLALQKLAAKHDLQEQQAASR